MPVGARELTCFPDPQFQTPSHMQIPVPGFYLRSWSKPQKAQGPLCNPSKKFCSARNLGLGGGRRELDAPVGHSAFRHLLVSGGF